MNVTMPTHFKYGLKMAILVLLCVGLPKADTTIETHLLSDPHAIFHPLYSLMQEQPKPVAANGLQKANVTLEAIPRVIAGKCYEGLTDSLPLPNTHISFHSRREGSWPSMHYSTATNWQNPNLGATSRNNASYDYTIYSSENRQDYVLVCPLYYAMQWLNTTVDFMQPTPITWTNDTNSFNLHFKLGGFIGGYFIDPDSSAPKGSFYLSLINKAGCIIAKSVFTDSEFFFRNIPNGDYALCIRPTDYISQLYPDATTLDQAQLFTINDSIKYYNDINWTLKPLITPRTPTPMGKVALTLTDSLLTSSTAIALCLENGKMYSNYSSGKQTISVDLEANRKYFCGRVFNENNPRMFTYWYPGTFFKAEAETLTVQEAQKLSFTLLPIEKNGYIDQRLPLLRNPNVKYITTFTDTAGTPLGADGTVDSLGNVMASIEAGVYNLKCIPLTTEFNIITGVGAVAINNVIVNEDKINYLNIDYPQILFPEFSHSLTGTIPCLNDPLLGCFDTLGNLISMTALTITNKFGAFNLFFPFDKEVVKPPYQLKYAINFLPPGKYTLVKVEPVDSLSSYSFSWLGGPDNHQYLSSSGDIAALKVPEGVKWITVDGPQQVVDIGEDWASPVLPRTVHHKQATSELHLARCGNSNVRISFQKHTSPSMLKIYSCNGALVDRVTIEATTSSFMYNTSIPPGLYIVEFVNKPDGVFLRDKLHVFR